MQKTFVDQLGNEISINYPPKRIVSVVPSQTELLFDLGLNEEVVGITKFCIHPIDKFASKTKVGGTKKLLIDKIIDLKPDLIIGNKEENSKSDIEALQALFPVWMSDIYSVEDAIKTIVQIGDLVNKAPEASYLQYLIQNGFNDLKVLARQSDIYTTAAYLIWRNPYMVAGKNTFIDDVLMHIGMHNVVKEARYPEVDLEKLATLNPDCVLLSSEPYPFKDKHLEEIKKVLPNANVSLVDGELFSWYGSRLVKAVGYLHEMMGAIKK